MNHLKAHFCKEKDVGTRQGRAPLAAGLGGTQGSCVK